MATVYTYEELIVWQEAKHLTLEIYRMFKCVNDFDFRSQIQRAAISIMNNIAEGFDRNKIDESNRSFIYFLDISYGSCGEVRSMTYLAEELGFISKDQAIQLRDMSYSISSKLYALIQSLKTNPKPGTHN